MLTLIQLKYWYLIYDFQTQIPIPLFFCYLIIQFAGASLSFWVLKLLLVPFVPQQNLLAALTKLSPGVSPLQGFFVETIATFLLITIIFLSPHFQGDSSVMSPLAVSLTLCGLVLFAGPITGASMNPARSFGPAIVLNSWGIKSLSQFSLHSNSRKSLHILGGSDNRGSSWNTDGKIDEKKANL